MQSEIAIISSITLPVSSSNKNEKNKQDPIFEKVENKMFDEFHEKMDSMDPFNHPRTRARHILKTLLKQTIDTQINIKYLCIDSFPKNFDEIEYFLASLKEKNDNADQVKIIKEYKVTPKDETLFLHHAYKNIHDFEMIDFLCNAWDRWVDLGARRDSCCFHPDFQLIDINDASIKDPKQELHIPPLIPQNFPLRRKYTDTVISRFPQKASKNVMGQMGFYCTDRCTPIVSSLKHELCNDAKIILRACMEVIIQCEIVSKRVKKCVYALTTHPGHHAGNISFGGYCYFNNAALAANYFLHSYYNFCQNNLSVSKRAGLAILDIDYHCGNGTADIFYENDDVMFVSIHCDPNIEYPFHSGHKDEETPPTTLYIPLPPETEWERQSSHISTKSINLDINSKNDDKFCKQDFLCYKDALQYALQSIEQVMINDMDMSIKLLVVSLGLDTHLGDPVAVPGAGFCLLTLDYCKMGKMIGDWSRNLSIPVLFIQEGGYMMDKAGEIVFNVLTGFCE